MNNANISSQQCYDNILNATISSNQFKSCSTNTPNSATITFTFNNFDLDDKFEELYSENNDDETDKNEEENNERIEDETEENKKKLSNASVDSLYYRRRKASGQLEKIITPDKDDSGSHSPPVQYNIFLNKSDKLEPPLTPSVANVVLLKYNLSPEIIKKKTENEFNFVIPLPKPENVNLMNENNAQWNNNCFDKQQRILDTTSSLKYHLSTICTIGKGSFGRVSLARHQQTGKYYALKMLCIASVIEKSQVEHVHNEKRILELLNHPFIVKLYDTAKDQKNLYMILEYLPGGELFSYYRMSKKFSSSIVKFYAAEIISALEYLHSMSIAYRDLKLENLMLTKDGHIKLTDFGFAKKIDNKSYTFCGTLDYLAPEIIQRKGHNLLADNWALGVLIFELMAGHTPFQGKSSEDMLNSILEQNGKIEFPRKTFSPIAKDLINGLLQIKPKERLGKKSIEEVKQHEWFNYCDWQAIYDKAIKPPLVPTIYYEGDTGNFDSYDDLEEPRPAQQRELDLFDEW